MAFLGTGNDNINIDGADPTFVDFGGADTYTLLPTLSADVTITDNDGGTINLPDGIDITAASFLADGVQFTINGNTVTIIGDPSLMTFVFGGTPITPGAGTDLSFADTAAAFGTTVPASGEPANDAVNTGPINDDGTVGDSGKTPEELYAEAIAEANDALADATAAQAAADAAEAAVVDQATAEAYKAAADAAKAAADAAKAAADNAAAAAANTADAADDAEAATAVAAADAAVATADAEVANADQVLADNTPNPGQTFTLTENADILPGLIGSNGDDDTSGDDLIIAAESVSGGVPSNNLGSGDVLNPGDGFDTLRIIDTNGATLIPNSMNLERIDVQTPGLSFFNPTLNLNNADGLEQLWHVNSDFGGVNTAFQSVGDVIAGFENVGNTDPNNLASAFMNINHMFDGVTDGAVDIVTTNSNASLFVDVRDSTVDTVNIDSSGPGSILGLTVVGSDTPITMLNISGDGALDLDDFGGDHIRDLTMVNVTNTGGVDVDLTANDEDITVMGGDGDDRFLFDADEADGDDVLDGGAGDGDILALQGNNFDELDDLDANDDPDSPIVDLVNGATGFEILELQPSGPRVELNPTLFMGIDQFVIRDGDGFGDTNDVLITDAENSDTFTIADETGGPIGTVDVTAEEDADTLTMNLGGVGTNTVFLTDFDTANIDIAGDFGFSTVFDVTDDTDVNLTGDTDEGALFATLLGQGTLDASALETDAPSGPNVISGDDAEQTLIGTENDDVILGNGGDDDLQGGDGDDLLDGGQSAAAGSTPDVATIDLSGITVQVGTQIQVMIGGVMITATATSPDVEDLISRLALEIGLETNSNVTDVVETAEADGTNLVITSPDTDPGRNLLDPGVPPVAGVLDPASFVVTQPIIDEGVENVTPLTGIVTDTDNQVSAAPATPTILEITFDDTAGNYVRSGSAPDLTVDITGSVGGTFTLDMSNPGTPLPGNFNTLTPAQQAAIVATEFEALLDADGNLSVTRVGNVLTVTADAAAVGLNGIALGPVTGVGAGVITENVSDTGSNAVLVQAATMSVNIGALAGTATVTDNMDTGFEVGDVITITYQSSDVGAVTITHNVNSTAPGAIAAGVAFDAAAALAAATSGDFVFNAGNNVNFAGNGTPGADIGVTAITIDEAAEAAVVDTVPATNVSLVDGVGNSVDFGKDTYTGGDGDDTFVVQAAEDVTNFLLTPNDILDAADVIKDFVDGDDLISFSVLGVAGTDDNYSEGAVSGFGNITGALAAALSELQADTDLQYSAQQVGGDVFIFASTGGGNDPIDVVQLTGVTLGDLSNDGSFLV